MYRIGTFLRPKLQMEFQPHSCLKRSLIFLSRPSYAKQLVKDEYFISYGIGSYLEMTNKSSRNITISGSFALRRHVGVSSNNNKTCWNCNNVLKSASLFCDSCNSLQPVNKQEDLFNVLGVNRTYRLNQSELKQKFRNLQTLLHPDRFTNKPKKEQELSEESSSLVNKAYTTLLDPLERGLYLLKLNNVSIEEGSTDEDKLFLMEIMERNEEIENESNTKKLNEFFITNRKQLDSLVKKVEDAFESNDIELARKFLKEMKYYNTIAIKIKEIKQKHNIPD